MQQLIVLLAWSEYWFNRLFPPVDDRVALALVRRLGDGTLVDVSMGMEVG